MSGFAPDHLGADVRVSPNFGPRRGSSRPDMLVLHYTGMASGADAEAWLCNPESEVSSHYLVHEDGRIVQMVRESDRAWHAGKSSWRGEADINSHSVGIEIVNPGHVLGYRNFPRRQIGAVIALCRGIVARHAIRPERVLAHSDVAPGRKVDPGEKFPWRQLAQAGVGHFVAPLRAGGSPVLGPGDRGAAVEELQSMLSLYGYGIEISGVFDQATGAVVRAFQLHFRPRRVDGLADRSSRQTLCKLLEALPAI
jgi:N-acetylmuramoyl-L-alanine amidase